MSYSTSPRMNGQKGSIVVPYTRADTFKPQVLAAAQGVAPLMGMCSEHIGQKFPETTEEMASAVRYHPVFGDLFMFPSYEDQRYGLDDAHNDSSSSLAAHQLATRLEGRLSNMRNTDFEARFQLRARHHDSDDSHRQHGSPLIYELVWKSAY